jgi:hypothetical protein
MSDNKKPADFRPRWDELRRAWEALENDTSTDGLRHDDPRMREHEAQLAASDALKMEAAEEVWATRARDPADLLLLAEIAYDRFFDLRGFPSLPADIEEDVPDRSAVAYLVRGIADVAAAQAVPPPPARREPSGTLVAEIARMVASVAEDEARIGVLSTGEAIAVALVLNRADLLPHGGYTWIEAVDRLGPEWFSAAQAVQRQRDT